MECEIRSCKHCHREFATTDSRKTCCTRDCSRKVCAKRRRQLAKNVISWRQRTKSKAVEYKGGKCVICGYDKCIRALKFHHSDPNEKDFAISGVSKSWEKIKAELDKCILVCGNCHDEIHEGIINFGSTAIDSNKHA